MTFPTVREVEDTIIKLADDIKAKAFAEAEAKWKATPYDEKKRPWPRCKNLTCNRTLECQAHAAKSAEPRTCYGFDF
jgi:hypothetical protein